MKRIQKTIFLMFLFLGTYSTIQAQQLLSQSEKSWKIHWGVTGGAGVSNFLQNAKPKLESIPEGFDAYTVRSAPRPEVSLGLFTELESQCKFLSFRTSINYMMRAIPEPTFHSYLSSVVENPYQSIYLNGLYVDGIIFFKPIDKVKFGLGFDLAHFFMTKQIKEGQNGEYAQNYVSYKGLKTVIAYNINARTDLSMYVSVGNSSMEKMNVDNISGGVTMAYKLKGREYKVKKEVYKIDYVK
jgi:hypothetical protein